MKQEHEFKPKHEQEQDQQMGQQAEQQQAREFSSAEALLRFDAGQTAVPAAIAERLQKSSANLPKPSRSWWQRFFKR
jgi:hypothetical protein